MACPLPRWLFGQVHASQNPCRAGRWILWSRPCLACSAPCSFACPVASWTCSGLLAAPAYALPHALAELRLPAQLRPGPCLRPPGFCAWPIPRLAAFSLTGPCCAEPMLRWSVDPVVPTLPCVRPSVLLRLPSCVLALFRLSGSSCLCSAHAPAELRSPAQLCPGRCLRPNAICA